MIYVRKNKLILKHCPYFYKIINFEYSEDDSITSKLITIYKSYIFNIDINKEEEIKRVEKIDFVLNKYIEDYFFRKDMKDRILNIKVNREASDVLKGVIDSIILAFDSYENDYTRNIYFARWI